MPNRDARARAFFGIGAYTVGLLIARLGWSEPLSSLALAALISAAFGFIFGSSCCATAASRC